MKGKNYFEKPRFCDVDVVHISDYRAALRADLKIPAVRVCARVCSRVCVHKHVSLQIEMETSLNQHVCHFMRVQCLFGYESFKSPYLSVCVCVSALIALAGLSCGYVTLSFLLCVLPLSQPGYKPSSVWP